MERKQKQLGAGGTILFGLLLMSILPRCNQNGPDSIAVYTVEQHIQSNRIAVGKVIVEVRSADEIIGKEYSSVEDRVVVTCGTTRVLIDGDQLSINDKPYGTIDDRAYILIDGNDVYINNIKREPSGAIAQ